MSVRIFMCGDVMLARGIDMIQEHSCDPRLYEGNGLSARDYVTLAERTKGPIPPREARGGPGYVWGDALGVLAERSPDVRIINLETAVTTNADPWPRKGIHYRMHPGNVGVIQAAGVDCCVLANNHTADWGFPGLLETLGTLRGAGVGLAGVGRDAREAGTPAVIPLPGKGRVLVFGAGHVSSGIPTAWEATPDREGLLLLDLRHPARAASRLRDLITPHRLPGDIIVLSIHWGGNWGFDIEPFQSSFAHAAIKDAGVDIIHGHSSHHVQGVEVYRGKLIIYGCGDFINDYEGITGHEEFRGDLSLMYFADVTAGTAGEGSGRTGEGRLVGLEMVPTEIRHLRVNRAREADVRWMHKTMSRECKKLGTDVRREKDSLKLTFKN